MAEPVWSSNLSAEQTAAAGYDGFHARLLAGPGTGKTYTLAGRVAFLVTEKGVSPEDILVLTFTRLATRQLRETIQERIEPHSTEMPYIATLHSFALRQLRSNAKLITTLPQPLRIADDWEERRIIQEEFKALLDRKIKGIQEGFTSLSADWETLKADVDDWKQTLPDPLFVGVWEEHRRIYGYTLRDELVYQLKKALQQIPDFTLESRFKYVLIDEYQDLNPCDLAIAKALTTGGASLFSCGDDDQSIYGFRHADPSGIRKFIDDFSGAGDLVLTECRRCSSGILDAALWVAKQDANRVGKELRAVSGQHTGEVHILRFQDGKSEANEVADLCRNLIRSGTKPREILLLLRSDRNGNLSRPLRAALRNRNISVVASAEKQRVLSEKPGRNLLSMLRIIANRQDHLAWRSRFELADGIGKNTINPIYRFASDRGIRFSDAIMRLSEFEDLVPINSRDKLSQLISSTMETAENWAKALHETDEDVEETTEDLIQFVTNVAQTEIPDEEGRADVVSWIADVIVSSGAVSIQDLLASIAVGRDDLEPEIDENSVNVLTMHQAKGLSADAVFVIAAEDEILPYSEEASAIADDRRLLYVSMTRARKKLFITYSGRRTGAQMHSGRNTGQPQRSLTRFLRNSSLPIHRGEEFVQTYHESRSMPRSFGV